MGTRSVQYAFDASAAGSVFSNGARLESVTYRSGRVVFNDYGSAGTPPLCKGGQGGSAHQSLPARGWQPPGLPINLLAKRPQTGINSLTVSYHLPYRLRETNSAGTILTEYSYTGARRMVIADYPAPDFKLDLFRGTAGTYAGLDRFARTIDQFWDGYGATADVDRFKYAYDYAGNRTYRDIDASIYATNNKDQAYAYDSLHRLITSDQGTLSGSTISGTPLREEDFTLDALGNWSNYLTKASGTTDLNQARTHNDANEITQIDSSSTHIAHDAAGNTTKAPKPTAWSSHFDLAFDAWNRLVEVKDGANTVTVYRYDGRNYRITKAVYSGGVLSYTDHTYYNDAWQALEVRRETSSVEDTDPREQFVWHPDYIDSLAVRYFDADTDGNLAESSDGPHYYAHDANYNVTAVINASGTVLERYQYDPYGRLTVLDANFATDADGQSDIDNGTTYTGRLFDAESGRYYYRFRYYDPMTGMFVSRDAIRYDAHDNNLYNYCYSTPIASTDPLGLQAKRPPPGDELDLINQRGKNGCVTMPLTDYVKWLRDNNWPPWSRGQQQQYFRGCIGVATAYQACDPSTGPYQPWPEEAANTSCYMTEESAKSNHTCGDDEEPFFFAKMGQWNGGSEPIPGDDGTIPNDSVVANDDGTFNYVTLIPSGVYADMNHCRLDRFGRINVRPGVDEHPVKKQLIRFCKNHPGPGDKYPHWMWCVTCKRCK